MSTPSEIMVNVAALMNDQDRAVYTDIVQLPYFNMALKELQETFELNNIPVTNVTSAVINVAAGINEIGFFVPAFPNDIPDPALPYLPDDLIEIQQIWESTEGINQWIPMNRKEFLPHYLEDNMPINQFLVWSWQEQKIKLIASNADNDLKLDYIKFLFATITEATLGVDLPIINIDSFMHYKVAAICSMFIGENSERATALEGESDKAMSRTLGISIKGAQSIATRRRPYRAAYKQRQVY